MNETHPGTWIMTSTGRVFHPLAPRVEDVCIEDIAHALAATNRFNGHTREPYSVAQHAVLVSVEIEKHFNELQQHPAIPALYGLLHDAAEAYLCDVPRPLKKDPAFAAYRAAEARLQHVIYAAFGLDGPEPEILRLLDRRMLRTEQHWLMPPAGPSEDRHDVPEFNILIHPWKFQFAKNSFLQRFMALRHWAAVA